MVCISSLPNPGAGGRHSDARGRWGEGFVSVSFGSASLLSDRASLDAGSGRASLIHCSRVGSFAPCSGLAARRWGATSHRFATPSSPIRGGGRWIRHPAPSVRSALSAREAHRSSAGHSGRQSHRDSRARAAPPGGVCPLCLPLFTPTEPPLQSHYMCGPSIPQSRSCTLYSCPGVQL